MSSVFVRPGQSAADAQQKQFGSIGSLNLELAKLLEPILAGGVTSMGAAVNSPQAKIDEQARQMAITSQGNSLLKSLGSSDQNQAYITNAGKQAGNAAQEQYRNLTNSDPTLDPSMKQGLALNAANQATSAQNQAYQSVNDPAAIAARRAAAMQSLQQTFSMIPQTIQASANSALAPMFGQASQTTLSQPKVQVGQGAGDILGGALGSWLGGSGGSGLLNFLKGGSGSGMPTNTAAGGPNYAGDANGNYGLPGDTQGPGGTFTPGSLSWWNNSSNWSGPNN